MILYGFMNDAENDCFAGKQHVLNQFGRGENGLELFISSMASLWMQPDGARAAKCWNFCTSRELSGFVVEMEPLSQLCVINAGRNLRGKLIHAEECLFLWKAAANQIYAVTELS